MKKKLFTLLISAFESVGVNAAAYIGDGGTTLYINGSSEATFEDITALQGYDATKTITKIVVKGDCTDGWNSGWLINTGGDAGTAVSTIDLTEAQMGGSWKFHAFNNLENIIWPDPEKGGSLTEIPQYAFDQCSIKSVTIPTTVKELGPHSFELNGLETVIIPEGSQLEIVRKEAFNNCKSIKDVYVNIHPRAASGTDANGQTITHFPWCEEQSFPYDIMVNQTAIDGSDDQGKSMATLHFAEEDFDYYCGNWKRGLAFTQKNLNAIKDGYYDDNGTRLGPNNGWQQFAMTGSPSEQVIPKGEFVRTYSSNSAYVIPVYRWFDTATSTWKSGDIFKCYRATAYTYPGDVTLTELVEVMPANTGMILRSVELNEEDALVFMLEATGDKYDLTQYPYGSTNFLETSITETEIGPVTLGSDNKVAYRNFGLYKVGSGYQFVRYQKGKIRENRAYLKLTATQFPNRNESATQGPGSGLDNGTGDAKIFLSFVDFEEPAEDATGISVVNTTQMDNTYYNLQGMKVENPSKGIYIYNGKKVIK